MKRTALAAAILALAATNAFADGGALKKGKATFDLLSGRTITLSAADARIVLKLAKTGEAVFREPQGPKGGRWWVDPAGKLCLVASGAFEGGACMWLLVDGSGAPAAAAMEGGGRMPVSLK